jgi:ribosomal-protein-alanine N-acetyltransferase
MIGALRIERLRSGDVLDEAAVAALLALEAGTQDRPLGLEALMRETAHDGVLLIARDGAMDGALCGFASARLLVDEAHVVRIAVDTDRRRQGIGRSLLDGLTVWAIESHAAALLLEVRASNDAALGLYAGAGMHVEGRRPRYYPDGEDALLLRRPLGQPLGRPDGDPIDRREGVV